MQTLIVYRKKFKTLKRVIVDDCNHYSDLPTSNANSENQVSCTKSHVANTQYRVTGTLDIILEMQALFMQELGIYSLLQPEEQTVSQFETRFKIYSYMQ